ncbi:MAG: hypothetical protein Sapg2KO_38820 [Saprospiraceae bacterium]
MLEKLQKHLQDRNIQECLNLIETNPEVLETQNEQGQSGFMLIAYSGLSAVFEKAVDLKKHFSLAEAIVSGKEDLVKQQLTKDSGAINGYIGGGFTPIALAAFFNQEKLVQLFLELGADPNLSANNASKVNALHAAVAKENLEIGTLLLANGADPNAAQMQQVRPLHAAVHRGNLALVKLLVENGASAELKMDNGDRPIDIAEREGQSAILRYFQGL